MSKLITKKVPEQSGIATRFFERTMAEYEGLKTHIEGLRAEMAGTRDTGAWIDSTATGERARLFNGAPHRSLDVRKRR